MREVGFNNVFDEEIQNALVQNKSLTKLSLRKNKI
jgi:hypothetical protein